MAGGAAARRACLAALIVGCATAAQARYEGNLNLFAGQKWLKPGDWEPVEEQRQYGLMLAFGEERAAVHFAIDAFIAKDDANGAGASTGTTLESDSTELGIGIRKVWKHGATRPHLGAGANVIRVAEDRIGPAGVETAEDRGYGVWVDGGVTWRVASHLNLGIEARFSSVRAQLETNSSTRDVAAGGFHVGLLIGYGW